MNGLRKRKKLSAVQLATPFTHAAHTSLLISLIYVRKATELNLRLYGRKIYATVEINPKLLIAIQELRAVE